MAKIPLPTNFINTLKLLKMKNYTMTRCQWMRSILFGIKKYSKAIVGEIKNLQFDSKEMVRPAPFVHRRFDSLNRPHVRTCSKLCNHPMNRELKKENDEFFKNTKISWGISDGKTLLTPNEELNLKKTEIDIRHEENEESIATSSMSNSLEGEDDEDIIPEELLLKYTKLDSPTHSGSGNFPSLEANRATPTTPTTRSQSASSTRRCKTPEKDGLTEEKKVIVLDLRRTKSTDAFSGITDISKPETKSSGNQNSSNGSPPKVINDDSTKTRSKASAKTKNKQNSTESIIKGSSTTGHRQPEGKNGRGASESPTPSNSSVVISSSMSKGQITKKKKKKFARHKIRSDSPDKENFYDNDDPGDTQIASSSSANNQKGNAQETTSETQISKKSNEDPKENKELSNDNSSNALHIADTLLQEFIGREDVSFFERPLERRALLSLKKQLEMEKSDNSFELNRLLEQNDKLDDYVRKASGHVSAEVDQEILDLEKELSIPPKTNKNEDDEEGEDFWLLIPRTFSSQSSRFELPMELSLLNGISPIEYLSRYVSVSNSRRLLYDKVFVRHRSLKDGLLNDESIILALNEVFGGILGEELQSHLWTTLGVTIKPHLVSTFNFKQFSGIAALAERMFSSEFSTSNSPLPEPKSEIEIADFDRLLSKLEGVKLNTLMKELLLVIKESGHFLPDGAKSRDVYVQHRKKIDFEF
ncbi:uncharacterized protein [Lepeophtheirus salmonis]|uniref:uncharacterized protein isoform X2 n=1 Tax=Lepeophtheirus salmonis TaxID=72036 RepID=UPI001AE5ED27|nr:uncharacterized protein LOC121125621 isoform X2 [Lepeophtheirus salmonis]